MGAYVYGLTVQTLKTPLGEANIATYIYKPGYWNDKIPKVAAMRMGRIDAKWTKETAPKLVFHGDPRESAGKEVGVFYNPKGLTVYTDDYDIGKTLIPVGRCVYDKKGKLLSFRKNEQNEFPGA